MHTNKLLEIAMNLIQKKYIQSSSIMALLIAVMVYFQDDPLLVRLAFIPVIMYAGLNYKFLKKIESYGPSPKEVIETNPFVKSITIFLLGTEIFLVYYWFLIGMDISSILDGVGMLLLAILGPMLPALLVSRLKLFGRLGDENL
ncbi:hypothetical protein [Thalassolituus sp.]|uniref:hypothetical protein n=1 Tax=Thalassolituus sp. TaxID=2030822 RepID=UPI0035153F2D